jgi:thiol-disulfide isomerase/thioredoxin
MRHTMRRLFLVCLFYYLLVNSIYAQSNITVRGTWKNGPSQIVMYYWGDAAALAGDRINSNVDSLSGGFSFLVHEDHPSILQLGNTPFLAFPGDTIEAEVTGSRGQETVTFLGPKGRDYEFFQRARKEIGLFKVYNFSFDDSTSIEEYKKAATAHYKSSLDFCRNYFSKVDTKRSEAIVNDRLTVSYDKNLLYPPEVLVKDLLTVSYYNDLLYPLSSYKISKDRVPRDYFDPVDTSILARRELLPFREFNIVLSNFNSCFYSLPSPRGKHYDSAFVAEYISSARTHFKGDIKNSLLLFIYLGLTEHGKQNNKGQVEELYAYLNHVFRHDTARIEKVHESKLRYDIVNKPFPKEILAQQLKTTDGKHVSWSEVLSPNKVTYVDFWASWCGPCMEEMPKERELISAFRDKGIEFVFISVDENEGQWKKGMEKINMEGNHYLISKKFKSPLVKYISFNVIPRYLIVDKNSNLVNRDAPRPGFILNNESLFLSLLK